MTETFNFQEKYGKELAEIAKDYREQLLNDVIPFWENRLLDTEYGGYYNFFSRKGELFDTKKPGWFAGRTMYTFSALYHEIEQRENWMNIAKAGRKYLDGAFYAGRGRFNRMLSREGDILEGATSIFTDHFAVKGLYEYIAACGENRTEADLLLAKELSDWLFKNVKEPEMIQKESPTGMQSHAVNFMTLQVAQESRKVLHDQYQSAIDDCVRRTLYVFSNDEYQAPLEYVGADDAPVLQEQGRVIDPGHTVEALWFCMQEGLRSGNRSYIRRAAQVLDWVIDRSYDEEYGGFYHRCDIDGGAPKKGYGDVDYGPAIAAWNDKVWWVQCEALLALGMSAVLCENEKHYRYFLKQREFIESFCRDKEYGEWYAILNRDGAIRCDLKGFAGKGPYHVPRCLMRLVLFFDCNPALPDTIEHANLIKN